MANVVLSGCLKVFIAGLTTILRAQLRTILLTIKKLIEAKLATLNAFVGRNDVIAQQYKTMSDQLDNFLKPFEDKLNMLPISNLSGCIEGVELFNNIQKSYFDYKAQAQDLSYKYAQFGFASNYSNKLKEELQLQLDKVEAVLNYLDTLATGGLGIGSRVRIYESGNLGTVTAINPDASVDVLRDIGGTETVGAAGVGIVNA